ALERPRSEECIRVQQDYVAAAAFRECDIVRAGKSEVHITAEQPDFRKLPRDHIRRAVARRTVDHQRLVTYATGFPRQRMEAIPQQAARVEGHDNHADIGLAAHALPPSSLSREVRTHSALRLAVRNIVPSNAIFQST